MALINIFSLYITAVAVKDVAPLEMVEELTAMTKILFVYPEVLTPREFL